MSETSIDDRETTQHRISGRLRRLNWFRRVIFGVGVVAGTTVVIGQSSHSDTAEAIGGSGCIIDTFVSVGWLYKRYGAISACDDRIRSYAEARGVDLKILTSDTAEAPGLGGKVERSLTLTVPMPTLSYISAVALGPVPPIEPANLTGSGVFAVAALLPAIAAERAHTQRLDYYTGMLSAIDVANPNS